MDFDAALVDDLQHLAPKFEISQATVSLIENRKKRLLRRYRSRVPRLYFVDVATREEINRLYTSDECPSMTELANKFDLAESAVRLILTSQSYYERQKVVRARAEQKRVDAEWRALEERVQDTLSRNLVCKVCGCWVLRRTRNAHLTCSKPCSDVWRRIVGWGWGAPDVLVQLKQYGVQWGIDNLEDPRLRSRLKSFLVKSSSSEVIWKTPSRQRGIYLAHPPDLTPFKANKLGDIVRERRWGIVGVYSLSGTATGMAGRIKTGKLPTRYQGYKFLATARHVGPNRYAVYAKYIGREVQISP